jgi:hypothetical protein
MCLLQGISYPLSLLAILCLSRRLRARAILAVVTREPKRRAGLFPDGGHDLKTGNRAGNVQGDSAAFKRVDGE